MKLLDKLEITRKKTAAGLKRRRSTFYNTPAYPDKLIQLFNRTFRDCDYGEPPPSNMQMKGMLNGFIKVCRGSHWAEREIYETIENVVKHWKYIQGQEHYTIKNHKKAILGDRPSLIEFLICRESVLSAIASAKVKDGERKYKEVDIPTKTKQSKLRPTEKQMQEEISKLMEEYE